MIIGISGKIGSGKDTIGKIIQYLTNPFDRDMKTEFNLNEDYSAGSQWQIKKFACKLKKIVSILTGIPIEDLEKQEVKDKVLGEEWWYYKFEGTEYIRAVMLPYLEAKYKEKDKDNKYLVKPTVRQLLQEIGTDAMRNIIHPNIWVNALFTDYKVKPNYWISKADYDLETKKKCNPSEDYYPNWIITDMRFPNELQAVKDKGGITIRVNRPYQTVVGQSNGNWATFNHTQFHHSETALDNAEFDYIIDNNDTIEDLIEKVKGILIKEKIINEK